MLWSTGNFQYILVFNKFEFVSQKYNGTCARATFLYVYDWLKLFDNFSKLLLIYPTSWMSSASKCFWKVTQQSRKFCAIFFYLKNDATWEILLAGNRSLNFCYLSPLAKICSAYYLIQSFLLGWVELWIDFLREL